MVLSIEMVGESIDVNAYLASNTRRVAHMRREAQ